MKLKHYRKKNNYTQKQIAEKLGITKSGYNHYEKGRRKINIYKLKKLSKLYNIHIDEILK